MSVLCIIYTTLFKNRFLVHGYSILSNITIKHFFYLNWTVKLLCHWLVFHLVIHINTWHISKLYWQNTALLFKTTIKINMIENTINICCSLRKWISKNSSSLLKLFQNDFCNCLFYFQLMTLKSIFLTFYSLVTLMYSTERNREFNLFFQRILTFLM